MNTYKRHRFPPEIISYPWPTLRDFLAVLYENLKNSSGRIYEELLLERGIPLGEKSHLHPNHFAYSTAVVLRGSSLRRMQRFLSAHAAVQNLFNLGRHLVRAEHYRDLRVSAFAEWSRAVA
jgi:hypothetical protein